MCLFHFVLRLLVKVENTASKIIVKSALRKSDLKNTPYNVFHQFAQVVQEREEELIPVMIDGVSQ